MDAVRLIGATRHALAQSRAAEEIVAEAWQAQALAQAVGSHLALHGPPELRSRAHGLSESGGRACGVLRLPGQREGGVRAAQLSGLKDPRSVLLALGALLGEVGIELVGVACSADEEALYWQCIEAIDATDEAGDRVHGLLRQLTERERWQADPAAEPS
ncbi:DUF6099 family protein [Streptomyces sp. NPDC002055]|uniref:DUF6099 family protein n=1 Tax=Streptomyces sp. NPDC002055 TaxID=3154534 RepID=UPI00331989B9